MSQIPLQEALKHIVETQRSYVGELAYATDEDLCRAFGRLRRSTEGSETTTDELLRDLETFGEAVQRVGERYRQVADYYQNLRRETIQVCLRDVPMEAAAG